MFPDVGGLVETLLETCFLMFPSLPRALDLTASSRFDGVRRICSRSRFRSNVSFAIKQIYKK